MAFATQTWSKAAVTAATFAAPTTNETFTYSPGQILYVKVGGTATTITVVRPGTHDDGVTAIADLVFTALTSTDKIIPITSDYKATDGTVNVTFSQITAVTALLISVNQ